MRKVDTAGWARMCFVKFYSLEWDLPVIPIDENKVPMVESWTPYQTAMPTNKELDEWFIKWKAWGLAIICQHRLFSVDLDNEQVYQLLKQKGAFPEGTCIYKSAKGYHAIMRGSGELYSISEHSKQLTAINPLFYELGINATNKLSIMPDTPEREWLELYDDPVEVDYEEWLEKYIGWSKRSAGKIGGVGWLDLILCPWHENDGLPHDPSLHINIRDGGFYCHGCDKTGKLTELIEYCKSIDHKLPDEVYDYQPPRPTEEAKEAIIETSYFDLPDGTIGEEIRNPETGEVRFAVCRQGRITFEDEIEGEGKIYKPIDDDMVKLQVILFPSEATKYESTTKLLEDIQTFIHRYLDVREDYEQLASYYVLFTWVYDAFAVLPYLRFIGGWSTGKSRGLDVLAAICYKAMQVSGATTISPMFRVMEKFGGTLVIDEADIAKGDEYTEFIKVLNTGYQKGKPLLRAERKGDAFEPRAYNVYCPKIVATRHKYRDQALESRFLSEQMDRGFDKERIPLNLPAKFHEEAVALRNQLLHFRLTKLKEIQPEIAFAQRRIEPRVWQVLAPLMQLIEEEDAKRRIWDYAYKYTQVIRQDRGESLLGEVVVVLFGIIATDETPTVKAITEKVNEEYHSDKDRLTSARVGRLLRELGVVTKRYSKGYRVEVEASKDAIELIKRQYDIGATEGVEGLGEETKAEELKRLTE